MAFNYRTRANLYANGTAIGEVFDVQVVSEPRASTADVAMTLDDTAKMASALNSSGGNASYVASGPGVITATCTKTGTREEPLPRRWPKVGGVTPDSFARECQGVPPVVDDVKPLPKPARVEKWQRWQLAALQDTIAIVKTIKGETIGFNDGTYAHARSLLRECGWEFFGYAKPDKVEVGQRWRSKTCVYDVRRKMAHPRRDDVWELLGEDRVAMDSTETEIRSWEYLGMAESEGAKKEAPRPYAGLQSVVAAKTEYATVDDPGAPPVQTKQTVDQALQDARRANEEAAKRLIANPPEWAYPTAWRCAVLALQERANVDDHRIFPASGDKICAEMLLEECKRAHNRQPRISGVVYDPIRDVLFDAYARGMGRPSPLMGRPGVKGGISTCDLGGDYE